MCGDLANSQKAKEERKADHATRTAAKEKEVARLMVKIEATLTRLGDLAVEMESMMGNLEETKNSPAVDQASAGTLGLSCGSQ